MILLAPERRETDGFITSLSVAGNDLRERLPGPGLEVQLWCQPREGVDTGFACDPFMAVAVRGTVKGSGMALWCSAAFLRRDRILTFLGGCTNNTWRREGDTNMTPTVEFTAI